MNKVFASLLKDYGLTCMQWFVLGTIFDSGDEGIQLTKLAAKLQTGLPFITNTINLLESKGMVERRGSLTDSRSKCVFIKEEFKVECERIEENLRDKLRKTFYANITPKDLKAYIRVLYKLGQIK
jgi:DNA-binding MarR family transcriptional regulator